MTKTGVFVKDGVQVTIDVSGFEDIMDKDLPIVLVIPQSKPNWALGPKPVKVVDLLKVTQRFNIDGFISEGKNSGDTNSIGKTKLNDLKTMFKTGGTTSFTYDGDTYDVHLDGILSAKGVHYDQIEENEVVYEIKLTLLEGEDQ